MSLLIFYTSNFLNIVFNIILVFYNLYLMFYELRFPEYISCKFRVGISFDNSLIFSKNGKEQRLLNRHNSRNIYTLDTNNLTNDDVDKIIKIFRVVNGRYGGFRFKDWLDYKAVNQQIDITDGEKNSFQLIKTYSIPENLSIKYVRKIEKPVLDTVLLKIDNEQISNFMIDYSTGIITLDNVPKKGKVVSCNFEFDVPVRFNSDNLEIKQTNLNNGELEEIKLVEII